MQLSIHLHPQVLPATPDEPLPGTERSGEESAENSGDDSSPSAGGGGGGGGNGGDFELEVGVVGQTIQCLVGARSLARLPRVLWDRDGGGVVRIVPVLFTQGIDIQQSMSHASSSAREKAAFQVGKNKTPIEIL